MEKVVEISDKIWRAIQTEETDAVIELVHPAPMFVHMGITLSRDDEINVIEERGIVYKEIDFQEKTIKEMESVVILLNKLKLTAVVNGEEVTNPFVVTEVYTKDGENLRLASLSYTRINY